MALPSLPEPLLRRIVEALAPVEVWLFGSRARGDAEAQSDWDVLVIVPDDAPVEQVDAGSVWELCLRGLPIAADVVAVRRKEFDEFKHHAGSLCRTVLLEGKQVYAR